jgi:hypothetical protein
MILSRHSPKPLPPFPQAAHDRVKTTALHFSLPLYYNQLLPDPKNSAAPFENLAIRVRYTKR